MTREPWVKLSDIFDMTPPQKAHVGQVVKPNAPLWRFVGRGINVTTLRANTKSEARAMFKLLDVVRFRCVAGRIPVDCRVERAK